MALIRLNNEQLRFIQEAMNLYSRVGIGQFEEIMKHPTFYNSITDQFRLQKQLEVGDITERGEIVKITKKAIWTKGIWNTKEEVKKWTDIENIKLSVDYKRLRDFENKVGNILT